MKDKIQLLIDILLDSSAREDERGDAAIDLRNYAELRTLEALTKVASDPNEDFIILDNCAESIGEICTKMNFFDEILFEKMTPSAQKITFQYIKITKPELISESKTKEIKEKLKI
jgi:hypothetical protein